MYFFPDDQPHQAARVLLVARARQDGPSRHAENRQGEVGGAGGEGAEDADRLQLAADLAEDVGDEEVEELGERQEAGAGLPFPKAGCFLYLRGFFCDKTCSWALRVRL